MEFGVFFPKSLSGGNLQELHYDIIIKRTQMSLQKQTNLSIEKFIFIQSQL